VELPLVGNNARRWILLGSVAIAAVLIWQATQIALANHLIQSQSSERIERGIRLVPGNADAWDRLGRYRQWDLMNPDPSSAIEDYKNAVQREPTSPYYWMDLASAYEDAGNFGDARAAFRHAEGIYPASADVAWHYGNFLLREGMTEEGISEIGKAVRVDPSLLPQAVSRVWHANHDVNLLVDRILPPTLESYLAAIDFFDYAQEPQPALLIWRRAVMLGEPIPLKRSFPLIDELIWSDRSEDAEQVWLEALRAAGKPHERAPDNSVVWDGEFAEPFSDGGLGWRWEPPIGVAIDFDAARQLSGTRSVRLDFGGSTNLELNEPLQYVPVQPSRIYRFHGYLRTERISTESGLRFSIVDPHHLSDTNVLTDNLTGTNGWTEVNAEVQTGPKTHFLLVRAFRRPSRLFENKLTGTAWIADVSLIASDTELKDSKQ